MSFQCSTSGHDVVGSLDLMKLGTRKITVVKNESVISYVNLFKSTSRESLDQFSLTDPCH